MPKLNSLLKLAVVGFLSLIIPSFLSIFKITFDQYVAAQKADVQGASVVRVQTVAAKTTTSTQTQQSIVINFQLPKSGPISNLSQKPFSFPKPTAEPVSIPVNSQLPLSYVSLEDSYSFKKDGGRNNQDFVMGYGGVQGENLVLNNGNSYDLNEVRIVIKWQEGTNNYTSVYTTNQIKRKRSFYENINNTAEASIPFNNKKTLKSITVTFKDNAGIMFTEKL